MLVISHNFVCRFSDQNLNVSQVFIDAIHHLIDYQRDIMEGFLSTVAHQVVLWNNYFCDIVLPGLVLFLCNNPDWEETQHRLIEEQVRARNCTSYFL